MWGAEPALRWKARGIWHSATWAEYLSAARALGLALADLGVARGEVVTLLAENRPEWLYADMGAQVRRRVRRCAGYKLIPKAVPAAAAQPSQRRKGAQQVRCRNVRAPQQAGARVARNAR